MSKPLNPPRWISSTKQAIRSRRSEASKSSPEPNVVTAKPSARNSRPRARRTKTSSSTIPISGPTLIGWTHRDYAASVGRSRQQLVEYRHAFLAGRSSTQNVVGAIRGAEPENPHILGGCEHRDGTHAA